MFATTLGRLRLLGLMEGVSLLVLMGIAMPLKYLADRPESVQVMGWIHGVLFVLYGFTVLHAWQKLRWPFVRAVHCMIAAVLPTGTFWIDGRLRREDQELRSVQVPGP